MSSLSSSNTASVKENALTPPPPDDSACRKLSWKAPRIRMVNLEQHTESGHVAYCCEAPNYHPPS